MQCIVKNVRWLNNSNKNLQAWLRWSFRRKTHSAKNLSGKISDDEKPFGQIFVRRKLFFGENFVLQKFQQRKFWRRKFLSRRVLAPEMIIGWICSSDRENNFHAVLTIARKAHRWWYDTIRHFILTCKVCLHGYIPWRHKLT